MAKDEHGHHDESTARLLVEIRNVLSDSERRTEARHLELLNALTSRISEADQRLLNGLLKRSETIAKKLEALDALIT